MRSPSLALRLTCRGSIQGSRPPDAGALPAGAARKRRFATRTMPAAAVVIGSSVVLPLSALGRRGVAQDGLQLPDDPPSLTFRLEHPLQTPTPRCSQTQPRLSCLASRGMRPHRSAFRTPAIYATAPSFRSRVPTGSRGTRTLTRARTCPGGSTVMNTRSGRSSRCSLGTERRARRPRRSWSATSASGTGGVHGSARLP